MKVFIWKDVDNLTYRWHDGGGLVIVANSLEEGRDLLRSQQEKKFGDRVSEACTAHEDEPDLVLSLAQGEAPEPQVFIFPNVGCC